MSIDIASRGTSLAREEFISTHRPRLRVRNVIINRRVPNGPLFESGQHIAGELRIVNIGINRALIHDGHCSVFVTREGLPLRPPFSEENVNLRPDKTTLLSGEHAIVQFRSDGPAPEHIQNAGGRIVRGWDVYILGWVTYFDDSRVVRTTGFCRKYKSDPFGEGRLRPVKNPDYEYED